MFAIKSLNNVLSDESALPQQGQETSVSENPTKKDETSTDKEKEDDVKIEETTEIGGADGDLGPEPTKIEKGEDDGSTAAISECSSSTHGHTQVFADDAVIALPEGSDKNNETKHEIVSKEVVTVANEEENKEDGEENSPSLTLAQRMKEMFDSSSPDEPSNAFGKSANRSPVNLEPPKSVSRAKDMKKMFESPSPDQPSRAFSVGKTSVDIPKEVTSSSAKIQCNTKASMHEVEPKVEAAELASPTSVADLMVSMLWASSSPTKKSTVTDQASTKQGVETVQDPNHAVIRETVIEEENECDEDIEEITIEDENENDVALANDECFDDIIEEITVDDDEEREDDSVATNDEFFRNKAFIEVSPDFVETIEKGECDGCSYDEITADDSEYDEKTVDEEVLLNGQEDDVKPREEVQMKEVEVLAQSKPSMEPSNDGNQLHASKNPKQNVENSVAMTSTVPQQAIATSKKTQQNNHVDGSKVEKLNPRIARTHSTVGKLAEKLKMFDSPKSMEGQSSLIIPKQRWQKSKPIPQIKSPREESNRDSKKDKGINPKTPVVLPTLWSIPKQVVRLGENQLVDTSRHDLEDDALVEKIVSMVKEPGAIQNKHALAERITSLLMGKSKDTVKTPTLAQQSNLPPSKFANFPGNNIVTKARSSLPPKIIECPSPGSKHGIEANSYLNRINEKAMNPGLKQMRKDVKVQKLKHVDDLDTAANRSVDQISSTERKDEEGKKPTTMKPGFDKKQKVVDPEEIMARIWPKTPRGQESKAKTPSKIMTPESRKIAPRKLGNRLKMFESPPSLSMSAPKADGYFEKESRIELHKPSTMNNEMKVDDGRNQIGRETVRGLLTFQRLWRKKNSKRSTQDTDKEVAVSNTEAKIAIKSPKSSDSTKERYYSLKDLEQGNFDTSIVDMERWEEFLSDESFYEHFGLTKVEFYQQPKWKRNNKKRKVRTAF